MNELIIAELANLHACGVLRDLVTLDSQCGFSEVLDLWTVCVACDETLSVRMTGFKAQGIFVFNHRHAPRNKG